MKYENSQYNAQTALSAIEALLLRSRQAACGDAHPYVLDVGGFVLPALYAPHPHSIRTPSVRTRALKRGGQEVDPCTSKHFTPRSYADDGISSAESVEQKKDLKASVAI